MMKLAISTLPCKGWTFEETLARCRKAGILGLELRLDLNDWSGRTMSAERCSRMAEAINASGMVLTDLGTSIVVSRYNEDALTELKQCLELAGYLQTTGLRIMLGFFRMTWSEEVPELDYQGICRWLETADQMAGTAGKEIWIETHNEFATGKVLNQLFADCRLKHTKVILDVLHPLEQGEAVSDTYNYLKDYLVHVHIKDGRPWEDRDLANWKYTKVGAGIVPLKEILWLLKQNGYDGFYSLEWESLWRKEIQGKEYEGQKIIPQFAEYMKGCCL